MSNMSIDQVLAQMRVLRDQASGPAAEAGNGVDFSALLKQSVDQVNEVQQQAGKLAESFEAGQTDASLAEVMVSLQKANVSFQGMVQVRNKLVDAYKDVMNMSI
ncbi:flagellar hook-basal body complex protein FliE [Methylogaea oryzae]|uniref:Flagellar hook-basal body complex protein FliE n=1 Tax=Methylogaea oryzae TaxID=1295382 RepID=A0A8D4VNB5_9GAMM|nr:flagellar hook-basal body complex protein FliE [Methylogaea oryzae]BBL70232.1 flagellar hook-basal body complex protein FliE [Methylogaea oryzae]